MMHNGMIPSVKQTTETSEVERQFTPEELRGKILQLEAALLAMPEIHVQMETVHHFSPGVYMRELRIPKGTTLTGMVHKMEHLNILSQGEMSVFTEEGVKHLKASTVIKSMPGMKRAGYAHEDSVWICVHHNPTNELDLEKLEEIFVTRTYEEFLKFMESETKKIEGEK